MQVMLDIETGGTSPGCSILSIGAVKFNAKGSHETLYLRPHWGGRFSPSTIRWWLTQPEEARQALLVPSEMALPVALRTLVDWVGDCPVWGNGSDFDNAIVVDACVSHGITPWSHRQNRCYRTMRNLVTVPFDPPKVAHDSLSDASAQATHLRKIFLALNLPLV